VSLGGCTVRSVFGDWETHSRSLGDDGKTHAEGGDLATPSLIVGESLGESVLDRVETRSWSLGRGRRIHTGGGGLATRVSDYLGFHTIMASDSPLQEQRN
jgi:hypothetical protein